MYLYNRIYNLYTCKYINIFLYKIKYQLIMIMYKLLLTKTRNKVCSNTIVQLISIHFFTDFLINFY
jgi:hypothetical protein